MQLSARRLQDAARSLGRRGPFRRPPLVADGTLRKRGLTMTWPMILFFSAVVMAHATVIAAKGEDRAVAALGIIYMTPYRPQTPHIPSHSLLNMLSCPRSSAVERSTSESGLRDG